MGIFNKILQLFMVIFTNVVFLITMYYLIISLFGIIRKRNTKSIKPKKTFALIVAAHNEENVIDSIIKSLKKVKISKRNV